MATEYVGNIEAILLTFKTFKWEIKNFSANFNKNVGCSFRSPKFPSNSDDAQWYLRLYPRGQTEEFKDHLSLYLHGAAAEIKANVNLKILNNEGNVVVEKSRVDDVYDGKTGYGHHDFVSRDVVNRLNDDKLTIVCEIKYYEDNELKYKAKVQEVEEKECNVLPRLQDEYEVLLNDTKFSDMSLISEGKTIKLHKCILASRSSVFAAMLDADMKEKQENTVEIADVRYDVLVEMVRFIYARKVNNIDALAEELALAADKYALDGLKNKCEKTIIRNLNRDNVIGCLQLADRISMDQLRTKSIEFIVENANDFSDKSEFKLLSNDIMCELLFSVAQKINEW